MMMQKFGRTTIVPFRGELYEMVASFDFFAALEAKGEIVLKKKEWDAAMAVAKMTKGKISHPELIFIYSEMLAAAGKPVDRDDVWDYLCNPGGDGLEDVLAAVFSTILRDDDAKKKLELLKSERTTKATQT